MVVTVSTYTVYTINRHSNVLRYFLYRIFRFFGLIFVYFIGGIIFQTVKRGATGKERIPNVTLWIQLPSLVKVTNIDEIYRKSNIIVIW